ncbi:MAG: phytanoyl-CoA dioxygenase family protein [Azospirillaceae bacterium]|nr:phytanoyl-CoA dioxygenase family protein [Azospirillaceae bacterium]
MKEWERQFNRQGFLLLPGFYAAAEMDRIAQEITDCKRARPGNVVVDLLDNGERTVLGLLSEEEIFRRRMKINDLYLTMPSVRELALSSRLAPILKRLLGHKPALCNSLYLEKGSAQAPHVDALYMTPRTDSHLIASWVALEDSHPDAGPLEYFPGSHRIPQMRFSNGTYHAVPDEMPAWERYMADQVRAAGLQKLQFSARKGDVFIWHSNLLHGGGAINNLELTRKSLVFHYYSLKDAKAIGWERVALNGTYWMNRAPQPVPDVVQRRLTFDETAYLRLYPDVAEAVQAGQFPSGKAHFELYGAAEGRSPG